MIQNTYQHVSNSSSYISFDPSKSVFPNTVTTVQGALELAGPVVKASTTAQGVARLATIDEANAGISNDTIITPYTLNARMQYPDATTTKKGVLALATNDEANAGTITNKAIVPSSLNSTFKYWFSKVPSVDNSATVKISSTQAAIAGTEDITAMSPLKVKQAIAAATSSIPSYTQASESNSGLVTLATIGQATSGTIREGVAMSPYAFNKTRGNLDRYGTVKSATLADAVSGTADDLYISAKGFRGYVATHQSVGTVQLTNNVGNDAMPGLVLASTANVLSTNGGTINGNLDVSDTLRVRGSKVATFDDLPIGTIMLWSGSETPAGGKWEICNGGPHNVNDDPKLFEVIGYNYGGQAPGPFYRPDMRGLFARGIGEGWDIRNAKGYDSKGKPRLGEGCSGGDRPGYIQKQQVRHHKHAIGDGDYNRSWFKFGASVTNGYGGGRNRLWDSKQQFTNEGWEIEDANIRDEFGTLNSEELIGFENRPWNMSLHYIIKAR